MAFINVILCTMTARRQGLSHSLYVEKAPIKYIDNSLTTIFSFPFDSNFKFKKLTLEIFNKKEFPNRDLNPGLQSESLIS